MGIIVIWKTRMETKNRKILGKLDLYRRKIGKNWNIEFSE